MKRFSPVRSRLRYFLSAGERGETMIEYALLCSTLMFVVSAIGGSADYGRSFVLVGEAIEGSGNPGAASRGWVPDTLNNNNSDGQYAPVTGGGTEGFDPIRIEDGVEIAGATPDSVPDSNSSGNSPSPTVGIP